MLTPPRASSPVQVIGLDDVERLLGQRPFSSAEMRNIDRYRHGAGGKPPGPGGEGEAAAPQPPAEGDAGSDKDGGEGGEKEAKPVRKIEPEGVVAT